MKSRSLILSGLILLLLSAMAWAREDKLVNTGLAPAAQGVVETGTDHNGNTQVAVKVEHLAKSESLTPSKQGYLVWIQPKGKQAELLGQLSVNDELKGELKATTPYKNFDLMVTAEDNLRPETPSGMVLLRGTVERQ